MSKYIRTNLANLRFARGRLSQRDISQAIGIGQKTLECVGNRGASKGIESRNTLIKLCTFFKCSPSDFLIIEDEPEDISPSKAAVAKAD